MGDTPKLGAYFKPAILLGADSFILVHNHPRGNVKPGMVDREATNWMIECGNLLDIPLMDHVIISEKNYYSFYDEME